MNLKKQKNNFKENVSFITTKNKNKNQKMVLKHLRKLPSQELAKISPIRILEPKLPTSYK